MMACNPNKDLTKVVARTRIRSFESRYFFDVYLWQTVEDLNEQTAVQALPGNPYRAVPFPDINPCQARCSRMPYCVQFVRPWWCPLWLWNGPQWPEWFRRRVLQSREVFYPRLGEIHFAQGKGRNMEIVAHEVSHAALSVARAVGVTPDNVFSFTGGLSHSLKLTPAFQSADAAAQDDFSDEEAYCYIHGDLFDQVYSWLWKVDPPRTAQWELP